MSSSRINSDRDLEQFFDQLVINRIYMSTATTAASPGEDLTGVEGAGDIFEGDVSYFSGVEILSTVGQAAPVEYADESIPETLSESGRVSGVPFFCEYDHDPEELPEELTRLRNIYETAMAETRRLKRCLRNDVYKKLDRRQRVPDGLELWLSWTLWVTEKRLKIAAFFGDNFLEYWSPLESYIPDIEQIIPYELNYEPDPEVDVEEACLIHLPTGQTTVSFSVTAIESEMRYKRLLRCRQRREWYDSRAGAVAPLII